ncbi:MAG: hypothetical protein AUH78_01600 [Gemmatimonadetes bacterium 13_1_40CM_4_69_8]|nr:MAG: hypothetical protein AUH78_01600 [Gemmatimonadetes bacterium 13_1_40CM_4_69_8]
MTTVVVSPFDVANFPEGGGHFWVYMQYAQGLRRLGCDVYWLEQFRHGRDRVHDARAMATFFQRMERFGLGERVLLYTLGDGEDAPVEYIGVSRSAAEAVLRRADLLLNFHYAIDPRLLAGARRTALVDIDPGLTQLWISTGQLRVPTHDVYFTIGETVGTPTARFPDCGVRWVHIRPPVCMALWPYVHDPQSEVFTTVAGWWSGKWVKTIDDGKEVCHDNNKRVAFLEHVTLPERTSQPLELALLLAHDDVADRCLLERHHWRVRDAREVASTPARYQAYIQGSRGEWSCAKPFFVKLQNAWVSDRTACYLASGKPAVVQHTGPSAYLPDGEGLFRFRTVEEAAAALDAINTDYERHCRAAREIAATYFDAERVVAQILSEALSPRHEVPQV